MRKTLIFLFVLLTACASTASRGGDDAAVRAAMNGFLDALNALDADRMASYFTDDVTAFVPLAQADRADGRAAVAGIFRAFVERTKPAVGRLDIRPADMTVESSGNLAVVTFNVRERESIRRRTFVFRRTGDRWLISHFHASDFKLPSK